MAVRPAALRRVASSRVTRRSPVRAPAADLFDGLDELDLEALVKASDEVLYERRPKPLAGREAYWRRRIAHVLEVFAADVRRDLDRLSPPDRAKVERRRPWWVRKADGFEVSSGSWTSFSNSLTSEMAGLYQDLSGDAAYAVGAELGISTSFGPAGPLGSNLEAYVGQEVTQITESTRGQIADAVRTATTRGYSTDQLVAGVKGDGFTGLRGVVDGWPNRAETIARTETANAYNRATIEAYRSSGLVTYVNVFDGASCGWTTHSDPELANGRAKTTLDEAMSNPIAHPNCQRAFGARVGGAPATGAPGGQSVSLPRVGPQPTPTSPWELRARATQARVFGEAADAEPYVTSTLRDLEAKGLGRLQGVEYRLKGDGERTIEKILSDVSDAVKTRGPEAAEDAYYEAIRVKDALRYTMISEPEAYAANMRAVELALRDAGFSPIKSANNWLSPLSKDVNTAWRTPNGGRFELQFHTPESWVRKMEGFKNPDGSWLRRPSHLAYEELRGLEAGQVAERAALEAELSAIWDGTVIPPDLYRIDTVPDVAPRFVSGTGARFYAAENVATWGDAAYADWTITATEREAILDYQTSAYRDINTWLRTGVRTDETYYADQATLEAAIKDIDAALAKAPDVGPLQVYRGLSAGALPEGDLVGTVWTDSGYMSTSLTETTARRFANYALEGGQTPALMRITTPGGEGIGAWLGKVSHVQPGEAEYLIRRGARLRIVGDEVINGVRVIDAVLEVEEATPTASKVADLLAKVDVRLDPDVLKYDAEIARLEAQFQAETEVGRYSDISDQITQAIGDRAAAEDAARLAARKIAEGMTPDEARAVMGEVKDLLTAARADLAKADLIGGMEGIAARRALASYVKDLETIADRARYRLPIEERIGIRPVLDKAYIRVYDEALRVAKIIEEDFPTLRTTWSGSVEVTRASSYAGQFAWDGALKMTRTSTAYGDGGYYQTLIHEMFHSVSAGSNAAAYQVHRALEEGVVEMATQTFGPGIAARMGVGWVDDAFVAYPKFTQALETIREAVGVTADKFYGDLIRLPLRQRQGYLEDLVRDTKGPVAREAFGVLVKG